MGKVNRPVLFCVHGMWSQARVWSFWQQRMAALGYQVITPTLPHHESGADHAKLGVTSLRDYQQFLSAELRKLEDDSIPYILIGHSMGGLLCQQMAAKHEPEALVLVNSAAPAPIFPLRLKTLPGATRPFLRWGFWRKPLQLTDWELKYLVFHKVSPPLQTELLELCVPESGQAATEILFGRFDRSRSAWVDANEVSCPILSLVSVQDRIVPFMVGRALARHYRRGNPNRNYTHREYRDNAHYLLAEPGWETVVDEMDEWIGEQMSHVEI